MVRDTCTTTLPPALYSTYDEIAGKRLLCTGIFSKIQCKIFLRDFCEILRDLRLFSLAFNRAIRKVCTLNASSKRFLFFE